MKVILFLAGVCVGIFIMCLLQVSKDDNEDKEE